MSETTRAEVSTWLAEPLEAKVAAAIERLRRTDDVRRIAVMPDVHLAGDVCVGTVVATGRLLFPAAVGGDIGCGMLSVGFEVPAAALRDDPARAGRVLRALSGAAPVVRRHRRRVVPYPDALRDEPLSHGALEAVKRDAVALQLGTLGGGNHFIELQADEDDRLWLMIHSGSRAIGQAVRGHHLTRAVKVGGGIMALDADTPAGQAYIHDVEWARSYADANRRAMAEAVANVLREHLGAKPVENSLIACDHNHVARERQGDGGEPLWVHRKGAMPAAAGVAGVLPGSMGTISFHVEGRGCAAALRSSAHGAGRAMSRSVARRRITPRDLARQMSGVWFDPQLTDALREESPAAYKDVRAVLRAQHELVRVTKTLRPVLVYKGGG